MVASMSDETTFITESIAPRPKAPMPPTRRIRLRPTQKITRAHLAVANHFAACGALTEAAERVASKAGALLKTALSCRASLLASTIHPFSHLAAKSLFMTFDLGGETTAVLELDILGAGALLAQLTGTPEPGGMPSRLSEIEEAALAWFALNTLADLRAEAAFSPLSARLVSLTLDRGDVLAQVDARLRHAALSLELTLGDTHALGRLLIPSLWLQGKFDALPDEEPPPMLGEVLNATLPARCLMGSALMPGRDISSLTPGDVVIFNGLKTQQSKLVGAGRVVTPTFELLGHFSEIGFTLTRAVERPAQEPDMSKMDPTVPVEIEIELTRFRLPLHQLGTVRPGHVLPLHINAAQQVIVRIGDVPLARAELVEIEGEIGARIVAML